MTVYIGNIPFSTKEEDLMNIFKEYGPVSSAKVIIDRKTRRSKGYGFVEMENSNDENAAIEGLQGHDIGGRPLKVSLANAKKESSEPL